jgi:hypothetical protein
MKRFRRAGAATFVAVLAMIAAGQTGAAAAKPASQARLESLRYQVGLLSEKDAKPFLVVTGTVPKEDPLSAGAFQAQICGQAVTTSGTSVAGRLVEYEPSGNTYFQNVAVAFDSTAAAKAFMHRFAGLVAGCSQPYSYPSSPSSTFLPGWPNPPPKLPKAGDQRVADTALVTTTQGGMANTAHVAVRNGQFVSFTYLVSAAAIAPKTVQSVTSAMGARLKKLQKAAAEKPPTTHPKKFSKLTCTRLLTPSQLQAALGVAFQKPSSCSFALAQGAGGVDVSFTSAAAGGRDTYARLASGRPVDVKAAADALYKTEQNALGQTTETVYVLTENGDTFSISVRGDDAPKNQQAQLAKAATTAMKRLRVRS